MRYRAPLALAVAIAVTGGVVPTLAGAKTSLRKPPKPKPVCQLVKDPSGDDDWASLKKQYGTGADVHSGDITAVDVATGAKTVVAVLALQTTDYKPDDATTAGYLHWHVVFKIKDVSYSFERVVKRTTDAATGAATTTDTFGVGTAKSDVVPTVEVTTTSVRFTVPRSAVPGLTGKNATITNIYGSTSIEHLGATNGVDSASDSSGTGSPAVTYKDRTPSCLNPK